MYFRHFDNELTLRGYKRTRPFREYTFEDKKLAVEAVKSGKFTSYKAEQLYGESR